jgi:hypothetical protein
LVLLTMMIVACAEIVRAQARVKQIVANPEQNVILGLIERPA